MRFLFNKQGALGRFCVQHGIDQIDTAALAGQFLEVPKLGSLSPVQDAFGAATIAFGHDEMKYLSARRTAHGVKSIRVDQLKNVVVSVAAVRALQRQRCAWLCVKSFHGASDLHQVNLPCRPLRSAAFNRFRYSSKRRPVGS